MEEKAIDELWVKVRASCDSIFPKFSYIEIEFNTKNMSFGESPGKDPQEQITEQPGLLRRKSTIIQTQLLSQQEISRIKDRFYDDINLALEEAKRKHVSTQVFMYLTFFLLAQHRCWWHTALVICGIGLLRLRRYLQNVHESTPLLPNNVCYFYRSYALLSRIRPSHDPCSKVSCKYGI